MKSLQPPVRILLVDDSPEFLESAAVFLAGNSQIEVVGRALSAQDALAQVQDLEPDLVLMDISMPDMDGIEATRRLKAQDCPSRVVILTLYDNAEYRSAATRARADGFIAKSEFGVQVFPLIQELFGGALFTPRGTFDG